MLFKRVISATAGIIYLIIVLYFRGWLFNISVLVVSLLGMYEFYVSLRKKGYKPVSLLGYLYLAVFFYLTTTRPDSPLLLAITLMATMIS